MLDVKLPRRGKQHLVKDKIAAPTGRQGLLFQNSTFLLRSDTLNATLLSFARASGNCGAKSPF